MFCVNQHTLPQEDSENKHMSWWVYTCRRTGEEQKWHIEGWMIADFHFQLYSEWLKKKSAFSRRGIQCRKKVTDTRNACTKIWNICMYLWLLLYAVINIPSFFTLKIIIQDGQDRKDFEYLKEWVHIISFIFCLFTYLCIYVCMCVSAHTLRGRCRCQETAFRSPIFSSTTWIPGVDVSFLPSMKTNAYNNRAISSQNNF